MVLVTYRQAGGQPSPARPCCLPRQATGGLGDTEVAESWATLQPSSCGNLQTRRRLRLRPRSHSMLTRTWPLRLEGQWPAVLLAFPTVSTHAVLGAARPRPGQPSCLTAVGPKPVGATIGPPRPLSPSKATLAPTPKSTHHSGYWRSADLENWSRPTTPLPPPAMVKRWRLGFFWRELWRDTRADRWLRRAWALVGSARGRSRGSRASQSTPGPAAESGCGPATPGEGGVWLPSSASFWRHVQPDGRAGPPPAHAVLG